MLHIRAAVRRDCQTITQSQSHNLRSPSAAIKMTEQFQDAPQQKQTLKVCGFAWPAGVHLTQKMHHQIHSKSSRFIPFNQCTPGEQTPARIPTPRRAQASGTESADASELKQSAWMGKNYEAGSWRDRTASMGFSPAK